MLKALISLLTSGDIPILFWTDYHRAPSGRDSRLVVKLQPHDSMVRVGEDHSGGKLSAHGLIRV